MKRYVDRGNDLQGQNKTSRDQRAPFSQPRKIDNFSLPDRRLRRRVGYEAKTKPVKTQALCKSTGVTQTKRLVETKTGKSNVINTPLSYGLIKYQDDMQLKRASDWTLEFSFKLGEEEILITSPFARLASHAGQWNAAGVRPEGVYVLDQTLISNNHIWCDTPALNATAPGAGTVYDLSSFLNATQFDSFPLTTFSFQYTKAKMFFQFGLVESSGAAAGEYRMGQLLNHAIPTYVVGQEYHVSIVYTATGGRDNAGEFIMYVDGAAVDTWGFTGDYSTYVFPGEWDLINGITYATGQPRDIVVLNECTVRGSYSSTCKIRDTMHGHQTLYHDNAIAPNQGSVPWCNSPPRGTAIWDLRIWSSALTR